MAFLETSHVAIKGLSACVPRNITDNKLIYAKWGGYDSFVTTTGIEQKREASDEICSSDLCVAAAERLIAELGWKKDDIDALVFVSQTPDYFNVPATSCIIQNRMGLDAHCFTLDIALGCSGWVYALSVITALMQGGTIRKGLLLAGDTPTKFCSREDKSTYPLFGDAGTATALQFDETTESPMQFELQTDGLGYKAIIIPDGGYRKRIGVDSFVERTAEGGNVQRRGIDLELDGMSVFSFGISKAPKIVNSLLEHYSISKDNVDLFTFHQANLFMNEKIRKKLKIPAEKVPYCIADFGNTSCASIPLTLVTKKKELLENNEVKHVGCGFGVGLSWGAVYFETDRIAVPELIEI